MEFSEEFFADFIKKVALLDKEYKSLTNYFSKEEENRGKAKAQNVFSAQKEVQEKIEECLSRNASILNKNKSECAEITQLAIERVKAAFEKISQCKEVMSRLSAAEQSIIDQELYQTVKARTRDDTQITFSELLSGTDSVYEIAQQINSLTGRRKSEQTARMATLSSLCCGAELILNEEITASRQQLQEAKEQLITELRNASNKHCERTSTAWDSVAHTLEACTTQFAEDLLHCDMLEAQSEGELQQEYEDKLRKLETGFINQYPPEEICSKQMQIYASEPAFSDYKCVTEMPREVHLGTFSYKLASLGLSNHTFDFLRRYYPVLFRENSLNLPHCTSFGSEFNYLFSFDTPNRTQVVSDACNLGLRLFMLLPPGKVNFTYADPVTLGESFAMFTRLVDVDDRTSEVINGRIWSAPSDIEEKLRILTNHISNVTQRCLQGKYQNIYDYNREAGQNAEAYQVIMLMDYPAGLTDNALRLLEQIVTSGPKCGVFTIIYRNESQYKKISERAKPLIENIETNFKKFDYSRNTNSIAVRTSEIKGTEVTWKLLSAPSAEHLEGTMGIISRLRTGIKQSDKVVIGIEQVEEAESERTTRNGIRVPIGVRGANEIQYLTLGNGGSHHALIAGVAGSGKSSLLHTIILKALSQYDPDELQIYLVDFKRGVEFKIYADYLLPSFKVVAIESEREFGYNILKALEREQKVRADKFKRVRARKIDRIEDYRALGPEYKMPRILVILDEFHELFSNTSDRIGRESAEMMERIVRQGRAFGVHIILSSQSYANVGGLDKSVYDQMAVRIVLKCSKADATLLLGDGSSDIDQISIDDPGRAIYNSEAGNKEYNSHFRVAYIDPSKHGSILKVVSERTSKLSNNKTRILLSNIEDNRFSIFNQFHQYTSEECRVPGRLHVGEPLSIVNNLHMDLTRSEYSNLLMIGSDTDMARSMFGFTMLSLAINYWVSHGHNKPSKPFVYFLNYKPIRDDYFIDAPGMLSTTLIPQYIANVPINSPSKIKAVIEELYEKAVGNNNSENDDVYLMVFGYQRAEDLKSDEKEEEQQDILSMMSAKPRGQGHSAKEMIETILTKGPQNGVHVILWQDDFKSLDIADRKFITYFYQRIAFNMPSEDYSQFVGVNDAGQYGENTAVYGNRVDDTRSFRPYQTPDASWLEDICQKLGQ